MASDAQLPEAALLFKALFKFSEEEEFRCQLGDSYILMKLEPKLKGTGKYPPPKRQPRTELKENSCRMYN